MGILTEHSGNSHFDKSAPITAHFNQIRFAAIQIEATYVGESFSDMKILTIYIRGTDGILARKHTLYNTTEL